MAAFGRTRRLARSCGLWQGRAEYGEVATSAPKRRRMLQCSGLDCLHERPAGRAVRYFGGIAFHCSRSSVRREHKLSLCQPTPKGVPVMLGQVGWPNEVPRNTTDRQPSISSRPSPAANDNSGDGDCSRHGDSSGPAEVLQRLRPRQPHRPQPHQPDRHRDCPLRRRAGCRR
jgi:hypothetical protein